MRCFRSHDKRQTTDLNGIWDFAFLGDVKIEDIDVASIDFDENMAVPGCFDATPKYGGQRGLAAYRTKVFLRDDTPHRLILDGVHHWSRIFVEGKALKDHVGGFTQFTVDIVGETSGEKDVVVLTDNRFDYERCPLHLDYFDWYHFGGIARSVELQRLGNVWIDQLSIHTKDYKHRCVDVVIECNATSFPVTVPLSIACDGNQVLSESVTLSEASKKIERSIELPDAKLWSPEAPNLHILAVELGEDDVRERIGIREVRVDGNQILINDQAVQLLGFNRHEGHPQFGNGIPEALMITDIQQIRDMNCNFIRSSHYPPDVRFLDLCDEAGICVWAESIGWQHNEEHLTDPNFIAAQATHIEEMVRDVGNRPSVIMWGLLNEGTSHKDSCRPGYQTLIQKIRDLDSSRPLTFGCNHPFDDKCLDLCDIISINCYPGWYQGGIDNVAPHLDKITDHLEKVGQGSKPLIISEIGAGAVPGWQDWNEVRWSEQYQEQLLEAVIRHLFIDRKIACGLAIWQYCDIRTMDNIGKIMTRPRGFNNKGIVDEYRRPKLAYRLVKKMFGELIGK